MILLLKSWRNVQVDLKSPTVTWSEAFDDFVDGSTKRIRDIITSIQYYYKCRTAVDKERSSEDEMWARGPATGHFIEEEDLELDDGGEREVEHELSEEGLAALKASTITGGICLCLRQGTSHCGYVEDTSCLRHQSI